jgi:hypothetical protein
VSFQRRQIWSDLKSAPVNRLQMFLRGFHLFCHHFLELPLPHRESLGWNLGQ